MKRANRAIRRRGLFYAAFALVLGACGDSSPGHGGTVGEKIVLAAAPDADIEFGSVAAFDLIERSGEKVSNETLSGAPYIASFFFSKCAGPCPALLGNVRRMQEELGADSSVKLVSITVDPEHDTPEVLTTHAQSFTADPERWLFLTGTEEEIYPLMRKSFHLALDRMPDKDDVVAMTITHDTRVVVVDGAGKVRGYYDGMVQDEIEMALDRARHLAGE